MISIRHRNERGQVDLGWLNSQHSFSFGDYYDPEHMGYSALRVINDDQVAPSAGFSRHGHRNMEIISYVLEGEMVHQDSQDNQQKLVAGEVQLMSAGRGIEHSEYNASSDSTLKFLQIWIEPNVLDQAPSYQQRPFPNETGWTTLVTPDGRNDSLKIKQDMSLRQLILLPSQNMQLDLIQGRRVYFQQVKGELKMEALTLQAGDGAKLESGLSNALGVINARDVINAADASKQVTLTNDGSVASTTLVFDLP